MWQRVLEALQREADSRGKLDWSKHFVDETIVRADQSVAGAVRGQAHEALGRSLKRLVERLKEFRRAATRFEKRAVR